MILKLRLPTLSVGFLFCLLAAGVSAQEKAKVDEKPLGYQDIRTKLMFRSQVRESDTEMSQKIVSEIKKRSVDFIIKPEEVEALKKIGANNKLIKAIKHGVPEGKRKRLRQIDEINRLYVRFTENYTKKTVPEIRIAIEAGKEFLRLYGNDPEAKDQADFVRAVVPRLERKIERVGAKNRKEYLKFDR